MTNVHCHPTHLLIASTTQNIWGPKIHHQNTSFRFFFGLFHRRVCAVRGVRWDDLNVHRAVSPSTLASMHIAYLAVERV
jgi:hypothetical protein